MGRASIGVSLQAVQRGKEELQRCNLIKSCIEEQNLHRLCYILIRSEIRKERQRFCGGRMYSTIVGAGVLDSPFLGAARFGFIQTMWATKGRPYRKSSPTGDTIIPHSSFLTPHSSLLIPHSSFLIPHSSFLIPHSSLLTRPNDKIYKKLIKFFDK